MDRLLVLVRHGQSDWNLKNLFTGWKDVDLSPKGIEEARAAGQKLREAGLGFDVAYTSALIRAQNTLKLMLEELGQTGLEEHRDQALNERDYGDLSGLNKDDARKKWGEEQVHVWRRSYATNPPGGESLRDTGARVWPYYLTRILPDVMRGRRVIVSAHGNSLRSLAMVLDKLTPDEVTKLEIATGVPLVYRLNADTTVAEKQILEYHPLKRALCVYAGVAGAADGAGKGRALGIAVEIRPACIGFRTEDPSPRLEVISNLAAGNQSINITGARKQRVRDRQYIGSGVPLLRPKAAADMRADVEACPVRRYIRCVAPGIVHV